MAVQDDGLGAGGGGRDVDLTWSDSGSPFAGADMMERRVGNPSYFCIAQMDITNVLGGVSDSCTRHPRTLNLLLPRTAFAPFISMVLHFPL